MASLRLSPSGGAPAVRRWIVVAVLAAVPVAAPCRAQDACEDCHGQPDPVVFAESVHGFLDCVDCHAGAESVPHPEETARVDCAVCHGETVDEYASGVHGQARAHGATEAPSCASCHGDVHELVSSSEPSSPVHMLRLPDTCGNCHADPAMVEKFGIPVARPIASYRDSIHARRGAEGMQSASCGSCHGSHAIYPAGDHRSKVNHRNVPSTCGECHEEIARAYGESIHGRAAAHGTREAPVCTDCHGEHRILSPSEPGSPVYPSNIPRMTCGRCHGDLRLAEKFGIAAGTVPAYEDSYHGLAGRAGALTVAHCASCHGVHDILPSTDPRSHVHPDRLAATCGSCHPGAGTRFSLGPVHVNPEERRHAAVYWTRLVYLTLIYLTVGGMLVHNGLDLWRKTRTGYRPRRTAAPAERMGCGFRAVHGLLMVSFVTLVWTGFALTYPEAWWARPLLQWEESLGLRGGLHRGAAIVLLIGLLLHATHLVVSRRARACIAGMLPRRSDLSEFRERLHWFLGRRPHPPGGESLGYPEKVEYLALLWGMAVMALTGFVLWFENFALRWFPKWISDVATVIHFYEAVLASLAILVWHLYFVIFDPVVYPMDPAWWSGREHPGRAAERSKGENETKQKKTRLVAKKPFPKTHGLSKMDDPVGISHGEGRASGKEKT